MRWQGRPLFTRAFLIALVASLAISVAGVAAATPKEVDALDPRESDLEVFLSVHAGPRQVAAVERLITSSELVREYAFLDHEAAYDEFARIFADNPDLVNRTSPSDLPVSFRLDIVNGRAARPLVRSLNRIKGVDDVTSPGGALRDLIVAAVGDPCAADTEVLVVMQTGASADERERAVRALEDSSAVGSVEIVTPEQIFGVLKPFIPPLKVEVADLPDVLRVETRDPDASAARAGKLAGVASIGRPDSQSCGRA